MKDEQNAKQHTRIRIPEVSVGLWWMDLGITSFPFLASGEAEATGDEKAMTRDDVRRLSAALSVSLMGGALIIAVVAGAYFWVKFLVNHL